MADEVDATNERLQNETAMFIADACRKAASIPQGEAGECFYCGEWFARVVLIEGCNACGRCRDRRGLG